MRAYRKYYNATDDLLREDTVTVSVRQKYKDIVEYTYSSENIGLQTKVNVDTRRIYGPSGLGTREVNRIEITGDFSSCETTSGSYTWATWDLGNEREALADMSGLPAVGDTV